MFGWITTLPTKTSPIKQVWFQIILFWEEKLGEQVIWMKTSRLPSRSDKKLIIWFQILLLKFKVRPPNKYPIYFSDASSLKFRHVANRAMRKFKSEKNYYIVANLSMLYFKHLAILNSSDLSWLFVAITWLMLCLYNMSPLFFIF